MAPPAAFRKPLLDFFCSAKLIIRFFCDSLNKIGLRLVFNMLPVVSSLMLSTEKVPVPVAEEPIDF